MKISKSELKSIVKECLVEILREGLGQTAQINQNIPAQVSQPIFTENLRRNSVTQSNASQRQTMTSAFKDTIKREAGGNKVMESILADTAASTLPKMMQHEGKSPIRAPGGLYEQVVSDASPEDLFGDEAASKWANLAFMNSPTKK